MESPTIPIPKCANTGPSQSSAFAPSFPQKTQTKQSQGGPLDDITENVPGGELVNGAGDAVQNAAGNAVNQVGDTAGKALGGLTGGQGGKGGEEESKGEQLRLRLELNLDIEIQLKAKIHGDLTLGLLN
ncbi:hypothetical protein LTR28_004385 [Elasticomyces elasticus]|nr:hypothetical protein LTR28_004385 [Elasticomyces elasticus]